MSVERHSLELRPYQESKPPGLRPSKLGGGWRAGDPALTQPKSPGPQPLPPLDPEVQPSRPGDQVPTPPFAARVQPLILRHASAAPGRPLSISALAPPTTLRRDFVWVGPAPCAHGSRHCGAGNSSCLRVWLGPHSGSCHFSARLWCCPQNCLTLMAGQRGSLSRCSFYPTPGTTS